MNSNLDLIKQRWNGKDAEDIFTMISEVERLRQTVSRLFDIAVSAEKANSAVARKAEAEGRTSERAIISRWLREAVSLPELADQIDSEAYNLGKDDAELKTFVSSIQKICGDE